MAPRGILSKFTPSINLLEENDCSGTQTYLRQLYPDSTELLLAAVLESYTEGDGLAGHVASLLQGDVAGNGTGSTAQCPRHDLRHTFNRLL